ncbi:MAG: hypothetical protein WCK49_02835, partial [Myxococcaceae bacterium]
MLSFGIIILSLLILGILLSLLFPIAGTWERVFEAGQSIWDRERIVFKQFGFVIIGQQVVSGGVQKFFGLALGPSIWLRRRDFGVQALMHEGFPEPIAKIAQGRVLLHLSLKLSADRLFLKGYATPMKVEFYEDGSGIKSIHPVEPALRTYRKTELTPVQQPNLAGG